MEKSQTVCPHCGSKRKPIRNYYDTDPQRKKLNPWKCPVCYGVGGAVDWGVECLEEEFNGI